MLPWTQARYAMSERGGAVASYGLPSPHAAHGERRGIGATDEPATATLLVQASDSIGGGFAPPTCATVGLRSGSTPPARDPSDGAAGS